MLWTVDSRDWDEASVDEIVAAAAALEDGGILLLHDWPPNTVAAIPGIARVLREKNLVCGEIVSTSRNIACGNKSFQAVAVKPQ